MSVLALSMLLVALIIAALYLHVVLAKNHREDQIKRRAEYDALTGLYTRDTGEKLIRSKLSHHARNKRYAIALFDLDDMGKLYDDCGADVIEKVFRDCARKLLEQLTQGDVICHIMNDTVLCALQIDHSMGEREILGRVEGCRKCFERTVLGIRRDVLQVHASAGASIYPGDGRSFRELYEKADMALYWSKRDGKNKTTFYQENPANAEQISEGGNDI